MNDFQYVHTYMKMVKDGRVLWNATLHTCGEQLVPQLKNGRLTLWCPLENTYTEPGLRTMDIIRREVDKKHANL